MPRKPPKDDIDLSQTEKRSPPIVDVQGATIRITWSAAPLISFNRYAFGRRALTHLVTLGGCIFSGVTM